MNKFTELGGQLKTKTFCREIIKESERVTGVVVDEVLQTNGTDGEGERVGSERYDDDASHAQVDELRLTRQELVTQMQNTQLTLHSTPTSQTFDFC